ncbi:hypothetical protein D3C83_170770 [compost metagenome]
MPELFWWLSLVGASVSLAALVWKREPVLILAQVCGLAIYSRNLVIHRRRIATTPA